jgi:hypothetical protein
LLNHQIKLLWSFHLQTLDLALLMHNPTTIGRPVHDLAGTFASFSSLRPSLTLEKVSLFANANELFDLILSQKTKFFRIKFERNERHPFIMLIIVLI